MAPQRPTQFGLFGGEEEVGETKAPTDEKPPTGAKPDSEAKWDYPAAAFPPDPWDALYALTVREFEEAAGKPDALRRAMCRYFKRGLAAAFDHGELVDLLCVSNDLLAEAGFPAAEVARVLSEVLPSITDREIRSTPLD